MIPKSPLAAPGWLPVMGLLTTEYEADPMRYCFADQILAICNEAIANSTTFYAKRFDFPHAGTIEQVVSNLAKGWTWTLPN